MIRPSKKLKFCSSTRDALQYFVSPAPTIGEHEYTLTHTAAKIRDENEVLEFGRVAPTITMVIIGSKQKMHGMLSKALDGRRGKC